VDSWVNGAKGSEVKRVIDKNFDILNKRTQGLSNDISNLKPLSINFVVSDWSFDESAKTHIISIPHADYNRENPCIEVYIKNNGDYSVVCGGYTVGEYGIKLRSDMPYEGRVVIR
jgi:hypothetical protein